MKSKTQSDEPCIVAPPLAKSCRFTITLVCLYVSFSYILMTINLPMAIVCLNQRTKQGYNSTNGNNCSSCADIQTNSTSLPDNENQIYLDKPAQGMLLGSYFYGVVSVQLLVGWLCDKYGRNKLQMVTGSAALTIASFISPVVLESAGIPYFIALRVIIGIAMSFAFSSMLPMLTNWTTAKEQGLLTGIAYAGVGVANSATYPISGYLCQYCGWKSIFYAAGGFGTLGTLLMMYFVYDSPLDHPRVGVEEKQFLLSFQLKGQSAKKTRVIPWTKIFCSVPVWSVVMTNFFFFAVAKGTVLNLPIFVKEVLKFSVTENGIFSALPSVGALLIHIIAGPAFDYVRNRYPNSLTTVRKIFHVIGTFAPGALMFIASQLDPEYKYYIISLITIGYSLTEFAIMGGYSYVMIDMAPDYVGILQGINKTISLAPGFITPLVIAALTPEGTAKEWSNVFLVFGGLYTAACFTFVIFGSAKLQTWAKTTKDKVVEKEAGC